MKSKRVGRKIVEQGRRRFAGPASGQETRVVLDSLAVSDFGHHLDIEPGPLLQALSLHQPVRVAEHRKPLCQLVPDCIDGFENALPRRHVVALGVHRESRHPTNDLPGEWIEEAQILDLVVEELDTHRILFRLRRVHVDDLAAHAIRPAVQLDLVPRVLELRETPEDEPLVYPLSSHQMQDHLVVGGRIAETVDGRHGSDDHAVAVLQQSLRRRQPHLLDVVVDRRVLLDVRVGRRNVGLGLVVIVIGDEVLDGVVREEIAHLPVELCGQGLVGSEHQRRSSDLFDNLRHRERLSGAGDAKQRLVGEPGLDPFDELPDRGGLISGSGEVGDDGKGSRAHGFAPGFADRSGRGMNAAAILTSGARPESWATGFVDPFQHAA